VTVYRDDHESNREWERKRQEFHGARYKLDMSDMDQRQDPAWLPAWGAPETLRVGQEIQHGPDLGLSEQFLVGTRDAVDSSDTSWWRDLFAARRSRRYRPTFFDDDGGDVPYDRPVIARMATTDPRGPTRKGRLSSSASTAVASTPWANRSRGLQAFLNPPQTSGNPLRA
jgi:hypothetical protein